jgi:SAM-dependent methyltransferase
VKPTAVNEREDLARRDLTLIAAYGKGLRILDVGAGPGRFATMAADAGFVPVPFDFSRDAARNWRMPGVCGDALHLPFRPASFDVVRAKDLIEHLIAPLAFVRDAYRLLRPGGILLMHAQSAWSLIYPVANFWDCYEHVRPYTRASARQLVEEAGFAVRTLRGYTAGRNWIEKPVAAVLARVAPYSYIVVAQKT